MGILRNKKIQLNRILAVVRTSKYSFICALFIFSSCAVKLNEQSETSEAISSSSGTTPTVLSVVATNTDGGYVATENITIQITFSEAVTVITSGGTPSLTLWTAVI